MKDFIAKSGLTAAQFAKKYDIPYNTVRQWAEGIRKAPEWLVRLFKAEEANKPLIELKEKIYICYQVQHGIKVNQIIYKDIKSVNEWKKHIKKCKIKGIIKECEIITKIEV